jgi:hypothetical protein
LEVECAKDGQPVALVEIDAGHCATCYADGIQMATGCTFGKGNIQKLGYGKFALTLTEYEVLIRCELNYWAERGLLSFSIRARCRFQRGIIPVSCVHNGAVH